MPLQYTKIQSRIFGIENLDSVWDFYVGFFSGKYILVQLLSSILALERDKPE